MILAGIILSASIPSVASAGPVLTWNLTGSGVSCTDTNGTVRTTCDSETPSAVVLGNSTNYTTYGITATGYKDYAFSKTGDSWALQSNNLPGQGSGTLAQLYAKTAGTNENGLGFNNSTNSYSISASSNNLIVLNLGSRFRFQNISLQPGSTSSTEKIQVAQYNLDASGNLSGSISYTTPQASNGLIALNPAYQYIAVYATSGNVLLAGLQVEIPEPGSMALLGGGLVTLWTVRRRRARCAS